MREKGPNKATLKAGSDAINWLDQNGNPIQVSTEYQQMVDNLPFLKNISDSQEDTQ